MDADFPLKKETEEILNCAFEIHNALGHGFHEKPYENALAVEFSERGIAYDQQARFPMNYKSVKVGEFIPDLIAFGKVVIDTKTISRISDKEIGQMLNYLRITGLPVGMLLNFKNPRLEYRRVVLSTNH
jgi:GxxExxY protein